MKRLLKNESGMSMALAVIMIALIGVMGAGLLGFAVTDLNQVVETNRGQKAFETAEAGIQAAKRRLLSGSCPESYDGAEAGVADPDNACADFEESDWSYAAVAGENDQPGKELEFEGDDITVKIRYLPFPGEEGCISGDTSDEGCAPEMPEGDDDQRRFFEVESLSETDSGGARRRIQAIYGTYDLGVPKAYFSLTDIDVNGNSCISNVSLFSLDDIDTGNSGGGSGCPGGGNVLQGEDLAYGDWQNDFNPTARGTTMAGIGTPESITGGSEVAGRDYDSGTGFVRDNPTDGQITFPFDVEAQTGQQDQDRMDFLRDEAKANGLYYTSSGGKVDAGSDFAWPANSTHTTVVFVEYTGASGTNRVEWKVGSDSDPPVKGTLVVNGGNFKMTQNRACLQGVAIVRGGIYEEGESDNVGGNTCLDGFVNASGTIKINGSPEPLASDEVLNRPGFYGVRLWSWREVYSAA